MTNVVRIGLTSCVSAICLISLAPAAYACNEPQLYQGSSVAPRSVEPGDTMQVTIPDISQDSTWSVQTPWETKSGTQSERNGAVTISFAVPELPEGTKTIPVHAEVSHPGHDEGRPWPSDDEIRYSVSAPAVQPSEPVDEPANESQPGPAAQPEPAAQPARPAVPAPAQPTEADGVVSPHAERAPARQPFKRFESSPPPPGDQPFEGRFEAVAAAAEPVPAAQARQAGRHPGKALVRLLARREIATPAFSPVGIPVATSQPDAADSSPPPAWLLGVVPMLMLAILMLRRRRDGAAVLSEPAPQQPRPAQPPARALDVEAALQEIVAEGRARDLLGGEPRERDPAQSGFGTRASSLRRESRGP
jgi:hypothetical protein